MHRIENIELTVLCMIYNGDKILLQNRVKKDWCGYTLPGGHIEPGESVVEAVVREIKEETGLDIFEPRLCGLKQFPINGGRYLVFLFKTDKFRGNLVSSEEGTIEWVQRNRIPSLTTVQDFDKLLSVFEDDSVTEFIYVPNDEQWEVVLK